MLFVVFLLLWAFPVIANAATYYVQNSPGTAASNCTEAQDIDTPHDTIAEGVACLSAGDTLYLRSGTYTQSINLMSPTVKTGTAGNPITIAGYPGETVIIRYTETVTNGIGGIRARGNISYVTFRNLDVDGVNYTNGSGWQIRDGNHHITLDNVRVYNQMYNGIYVQGDDITIINSVFRDSRSSPLCTNGLYYGLYFHHGNRFTVRNNEFYNNKSGGLHIYPGPATGVVIDKNSIHNNNWCGPQFTSSFGGILIATDSSSTGSINGTIISNNLIYLNGTDGNGGAGAALRIQETSASSSVTNTLIYNNTIYGNESVAGAEKHGIVLGGQTTNAIVRNNLVVGNPGGGILNGATNSTLSNNITTGTITDYTVSTSDLRLKDGTNAAVDAGTAVSTRDVTVGANDVGAYERGMVSSAVVADGFIEVTINVSSPGVLPTSGITGFTIANGTSTGTPVVSSAAVKPGSSNVIQLTVSGFTGTGSCTISYSGGNVTDSGYVGTPSTGSAQGINSASGVSVSGPCDNSAGGTPPAGSLHVHHTVDEGTGTSLNDETANNLDSTISGSPTWTTTGISGGGLSFPNDGVDRRVTFQYGDTINPTSQSFSFCLWVKPDAGLVNKVIMGPPTGTDQRMYIGIHQTNNTWGIGVGASTITATGASEFSVVNTWTRLCLINDASTDIVTLAVNGVKGTSAAAVKSSSSVTDLAGNFLIGCGFGLTAWCGGFEMDEPKIWTLALSAAELVEDYESYTPPGGSVSCYKQQDFQAQRVYLDESSDPINYGSAGAASIEVVAGGAVALVMQVDCTGSAGSPLALQWLYSKNGGAYEHGIPLQFTADGIAMWGSDTDSSLNRFTVADCVSGALTENYGPTQLVAGATPTIELSQDHSYCIRAIIKVDSDQAGNYFQIRLYQDNSAVLDGGYTATPRIDVVAPLASGGF